MLLINYFVMFFRVCFLSVCVTDIPTHGVGVIPPMPPVRVQMRKQKTEEVEMAVSEAETRHATLHLFSYFQPLFVFKSGETGQSRTKIVCFKLCLSSMLNVIFVYNTPKKTDCSKKKKEKV